VAFGFGGCFIFFLDKTSILQIRESVPASRQGTQLLSASVQQLMFTISVSEEKIPNQSPTQIP